MSDKVNIALVNLEKARTAALETAIAERVYRAAAVLDADGHVQRGIERARRLLNGKTPKTATSKK